MGNITGLPFLTYQGNGKFCEGVQLNWLVRLAVAKCDYFPCLDGL